MLRLLYISLIFVSACGYQWGNRTDAMPGGHKNIAVPMFKNNTDEVGAEVYFTNAMIEEITRSQSGFLTNINDAEVVLEGEIRDVILEGEGLASLNDLPSGAELVSNYSLKLRVNLRLRRKRDQQIIWSKNVSGSSTFASAKIARLPANSANPLYNQSALHKNLKEMAGDLMQQAHLSLTESF